jgi:hypothetical protein
MQLFKGAGVEVWLSPQTIVIREGEAKFRTNDMYYTVIRIIKSVTVYPEFSTIPASVST